MPHSVESKAGTSLSAEVEMAETATDVTTEDVDMTDAVETNQTTDKGAERSGMVAAGVKLEDLFDMGSDDDEFPSSAAPVKREASNSPDLLPDSPL